MPGRFTIASMNQERPGTRERQPVGRDAPVQMIDRHDAGRALHVLDDDVGLARNEAAQMPRHRARAGVDAAARRIADDHGQRLALVEIGGGRARPCGQRPAMPTDHQQPQELHRLPNQ